MMMAKTPAEFSIWWIELGLEKLKHEAQADYVSARLLFLCGPDFPWLC